MTRDRDIEVVLSHWLEDGPVEVPDRIIDAVSDRIEHQSQRPAWRLHWRNPVMHPSFRAAVALAAAILLAVGAFYLLKPAPGGVGGPNTSISASPAVSASPAPSGQVRRSVKFKPRVDLTIPAGWTFDDGDRTLRVAPPSGAPASDVGFGMMVGPFVTFNDAQCEDQAPAAVGTTAAQAIQALESDPRLIVTAPQAVTVGGRPGRMVDIEVDPGWTKTCDWSQGKPALLIVAATAEGPAFGTQVPTRERYVFLDVGDSVVAINFAASDTADPATFGGTSMPIFDSLRFTP